MNDKNLHFISEKIDETKIALFHCVTNSVLRIPNSIINTMNVDENGYINFFLNRPTQSIAQFDQEFPVALNYFKKGNNYFLNIFGKARMINDPEELLTLPYLTREDIDHALTDKVLIKVKILKAEFHENDLYKHNSILHKMKAFFYNLIRWQPQAKSYDFETDGLHHFGF